MAKHMSSNILDTFSESYSSWKEKCRTLVFSLKNIDKRGAYLHKYPILQECLSSLTPDLSEKNLLLKSI